MSTKTLRKRIALGTVVAVSAGLLSLVSTTAAQAAISNGSAVGGMAIPTAATGTIGLQGTSSSNANSIDAITATLLSTGTLAVVASPAGGYYVVSSGAYISGDSVGTSNIGAGQTTDSTTATATTISVTPTGAAGSTFTVTGYTSSAKTTTVSVMTVTIAGTSVAGVADASKSTASWVDGINTTADTTTDLVGASSTTAGLGLKLQVNVKDAYKNAITKDGAFTVTVSDGAYASVGAGSTPTTFPAKGNYTTAVLSTGQTAGDYNVSVFEKTAGAGWSGTVTISYNGVVVATKSGTIKGYPSKIVLAPSKVATKASTTTALKWTAYDASGNALTGSTALTTGALAKNSFGTATVVSAISTVVLPDSSGNAGTVDITCGDAGSSTVVLQYTRPDGGVILSNNVTQQCGGSPDSYKAAFDKTSYNQGDLATLTISVVDSKGNPASSFVNVIDSSTITAGDSSISTPMMTLVGAYPAVQKLDSAGKVTFTYTVGTTGTFTPGNYQASVSLPTVNAVNGKAQTVAYTIGSTGGTSLNDVLKGIVSLIASINKQIAALAKLVSKK